MVTARNQDDDVSAPLWIRRPALLHLLAYAAAGLSFTGQIVATILRDADWRVVLALLLAGAGTAVSWYRPWIGLVVTSAASFAVTAVGNDPLSVWMMAVFVLFSATFRGLPTLAATALVAVFLLGAFMTVGGFRGGPIVGVAALFSAIAGGASGAALRSHRDRWWMLEERAATALATRESEATRRVTAERLRIARDLHDVIGHQVAMLSMNLGIAEIALPPEAGAAREALASARSNARAVIAETQRILVLLRREDDSGEDEALRPTPSLSSLDALIASFQGTGLEVHADLSPLTSPLVPSVDVTVFRVVQEALTNAHRHGAGAAKVALHEQDRRICVTVENRVARPGQISPPGSGLGLMGMRERVDSCNGQLRIDSDDGWFRIRAEFSPTGEALT
ncbi:sensor histidine kinase [Micromonospora carbonacea]|uniref:sensor histidine kinase n=1 Tax=Micromonospora carbonacea TaxID=47853 RepID=UPI003D755926